MRVVCPICTAVLEEVPDDYPFRPFCSGRCKTIDLGNWLDEKYRISRPLSPDELVDGGSAAANTENEQKPS